MNKFRKIMVSVVAMALLVMGGTAVFAQQADGGSAISVQQTDDGQQGDFTPPDTDNEQQDRSQGRPNGERKNRFLDREAASEAIATALGITVEELEAAHEEGIKLPELAESLGVEMEVVEAAIEAARAEAIAQAVADGTITQEEADEIASHEGSGRPSHGNNGNCAPDGAPNGGQQPQGNFNAAPTGTDA